MQIRLLAFLILFLITLFPVTAARPVLDNPANHPPRIIRTCCMFGYKVGIVVLPFIKLTEATGMDKIGSHHYLGKSSENNGVVYTRKGGFIDMGHLRDQADWTAYLYSLMQQERDQNCIELDLGHEGGNKRLSITVSPDLSNQDLVLLAGRMAYDLSLWHEIATWYGVCSVPLVSEQFSSFSVEDSYSNLLGALLGMKAIQSELPYEEAMTKLIREKLEELEVTQTEEETLRAMEAVRNIWWTREAHMPSTRVMIARLTALYDTINPMLIPDTGMVSFQPQPLIIPSVTVAGDSLVHFYDLSVKLNHKFPVKALFPDLTGKTITQKQFGILVRDIDRELQTGFLIKSRAELASLRKAERSEYRKLKEFEKNHKPKRT